MLSVSNTQFKHRNFEIKKPSKAVRAVAKSKARFYKKGKLMKERENIIPKYHS
jgi:hypothetical protein